MLLCSRGVLGGCLSLYDMKTFPKTLMNITIESCKCLFFRGVMKLPLLLLSLLKHIQLLKDCMDEFSLLFGEVTAIDTRKSQGVRGRWSLSTETYRRCFSLYTRKNKTKKNIKEQISNMITLQNNNIKLWACVHWGKLNAQVLSLIHITVQNKT